MGSLTRRTGIVLTVALAPLVAASLASAADTIVGDASAPTNVCSGTYTYLQVAAPSGASYVTPAGVITAVHITADPGNASVRGFKLGRLTAPNTWTIVGSTPLTSIPAGTTSNDKVRIPTKAGDVLGTVNSSVASVKCIRSGSSGDALAYFGADVPVNATISSASTTPSLRLPVSVTVEPDADLDGYGDSTQDGCTNQPQTHGVCAFSLGAATGKRKVGKTLTAPAVSVPLSTTATYQWFRVTKKKQKPAKATAISGATATTYKLKAKDRGKQVFVRVVLSRTGYDPASADSVRNRIH